MQTLRFLIGVQLLLLLGGCGFGSNANLPSALDQPSLVNGGVNPPPLLGAGLPELLNLSRSGRELRANPSNYRTVLSGLRAGDRLLLAPGDYSLLPLSNLQGQSDNWILIESEDFSNPAKILSNDCCNTVEISNSSYLAVRGLRIDGRTIQGGQTDGSFGVSAASGLVHHIVLERNTFQNFSGLNRLSQQVVAISTKVTTWDWVIRANQILDAGTGLYLGNSDGGLPFIKGIIEFNLIRDTLGYNMQIKHQTNRNSSITGIPQGTQKTVIRHNVFIKSDLPSPDGNRPNLLLGDLPATGLGSSDYYEVYGNLFYRNPRESLMQAEGRVAIYNNLFVDASGSALLLTNHMGRLRMAHVFNNSFLKAQTAINFGVVPTESGSVQGNLIVAASGMSSRAPNVLNNTVRPSQDGALVFSNDNLTLGQLDLYPNLNAAQGTNLLDSVQMTFEEANLDFNRVARPLITPTFRGAYAGEGLNPGWKIRAAVKGTLE